MTNIEILSSQRGLTLLLQLLHIRYLRELSQYRVLNLRLLELNALSLIL